MTFIFCQGNNDTRADGFFINQNVIGTCAVKFSTVRFENDRTSTKIHDSHWCSCDFSIKTCSSATTLWHPLNNVDKKWMAKKTATFGLVFNEKRHVFCIFPIVEFSYSNNFQIELISLFENIIKYENYFSQWHTSKMMPFDAFSLWECHLQTQQPTRMLFSH